MRQFVYVRGDHPEPIESTEEIIRVEDLLKVYKYHDGDENAIAFDVWCPIKGRTRQLVSRCENEAARDRAFEYYVKLLEGTYE